MRNRAVFLQYTGENSVSKTVTPEFYRLYQQSVLLTLKEQGFLDEVLYQYCMNILNH